MCRNRICPGDQTITDQYGLDEIPYFIRLGSIIPCNPPLSHLKAEPSSLVLWVIPGADGTGKLYEDQGDSEAYKDGEFATTLFTQTQSSEGVTLTIYPRQGSYEGMTQERAWQVVFFSIEEPTDVNIDGEAASDWTYDEASQRLTVNISSHPCSEAITINFKDKETGIKEIKNEKLKMNNEVFDLSGRQMVNGKDPLTPFRGNDTSNGQSSNLKLPQGIYIQNGKKILIPYKP